MKVQHYMLWVQRWYNTRCNAVQPPVQPPANARSTGVRHTLPPYGGYTGVAPWGCYPLLSEREGGRS